MLGLNRYRVVRRKGGWFRQWQVMVGDSTEPVFIGTHAQCGNVQLHLGQAFNDGYFTAGLELKKP